MKIFFVGIHNKPGMKPLDSKTQTGKCIDAIIEMLSYGNCIKTNLFEGEYMPIDVDVVAACTGDWVQKYEPTKDDIAVLLGRWVKDNFHWGFMHVIPVTHPAGIYGPVNKAAYISDVARKIMEFNHPKSKI